METLAQLVKEKKSTQFSYHGKSISLLPPQPSQKVDDKKDKKEPAPVYKLIYREPSDPRAIVEDVKTGRKVKIGEAAQEKAWQNA